MNDAYPLKGTVNITDQPFGQKRNTAELPQSGEAWVQSRLFQSLELSIGDSIDIGDGTFTVTHVLVDIPDAGFSVFNTDPIANKLANRK